MIDEFGNKFLVIKFDYQFGGMVEEDENDRCWEWSLVSDNTTFAHTYWFSKEDYKIYKPWEIKERYFKKTTKLTEKRLVNNGFVKVYGKTYDWAYDWFLDFLDIAPLKEYITGFEGEEKEKIFWEFVKETHIEEEVFVISAWMILFYAIQWCEENSIAYKVDVPPDYPRELPKKEIKDKIMGKIRYAHYDYPFSFMNNIS